jgi:hypothetical protein
MRELGLCQHFSDVSGSNRPNQDGISVWFVAYETEYRWLSHCHLGSHGRVKGQPLKLKLEVAAYLACRRAFTGTPCNMPRIDDDTWDLASSVGATATIVAAGRALAAKSELIEDRFAEPLVRAVGIDFFIRWAARELNPAGVDIPDHPWGMQPVTDVMAVRTRYIDGFIDAAAAAGIRQAVILASGLDARGYRLAWPTAMTLFEIDQPQVLEFEAATLAALGAEPTVELREVSIDLRHDWAGRTVCRRVRRRPAHGVDRRGSARIPSAGCPGSLAGQHHRDQRRRQSVDGGGLLELPEGSSSDHPSCHPKVV